jgi:hypothetical protein
MVLLRLWALPVALLVTLSASAAQSNDYRISVSNNSNSPYLIFIEQRQGNDPVVVEKGKTISPIIVKETGSLFIASPGAEMRKLTTTQVYPIPTVIITKQVHGFIASDGPKINTRDVLVTIGKDKSIRLTNLGKKQVWEK